MPEIENEGLALFRYVSPSGGRADRYPFDPNGAMLEAAGITNPAGNILAFMPHPERASWLRQVPLELRNAWGERRRMAVGNAEALEGPGPGRIVFESTACVSCHTVRGTVASGKFGPDLTHLMSRETIGAGVAINKPEYLKAWLINPDRMKPGVLMPAMNLNKKDLDELAAYLATLR